jgi:hypothetical protein
MSCEDDDCAIEDLSEKATAKVPLFLPDPAGTLAEGYDRIIVERSKTPNGPWKQALKVNKGLLVVDGIYNYLYVDEAADPGMWFRPVLVSSSDDDLDPLPQAARQATDMSFEHFMTIEELRRIYLFGVDLTDDANRPYPHELFAHYIRAAMSFVEHDADLTLIPKKMTAQHDYWRRDFYNYGFVKLRDNPIISVEKYEVRYPSAQSVLSFNKDWIRLDKHSGQVQVFPTSGEFPSCSSAPWQCRPRLARSTSRATSLRAPASCRRASRSTGCRRVCRRRTAPPTRVTAPGCWNTRSS